MTSARSLVLGAALLVVTAASAQTPYGSLRGSVAPASEAASDYTGVMTWPGVKVGSADTVTVARVTLTPISTYGCRAGRRVCAPAVVAARGAYGAFDAGWLYMGRYRVRAEAAGCAVWEAEIVVTQHQEAVLNLPLQCTAVAKRR